MAIPTKEEFDVFIEANNSINAIELHQKALEAFQRHTPLDSFYEDSYEIINKKNEIINSKISKLTSTEVYKWLYKQRPFIVAKEAVFKHRSTSAIEASRIKNAQSLQKAFELFLCDYEHYRDYEIIMAEERGVEIKTEGVGCLPSHFKIVLNGLLHVGGRKTWHSGIATALSTYFYGEAESSLAKRRELTEKLTKVALKSLTDLEAHIATLSLGERVNLNTHNSSSDELLSAIDEIKGIRKLNKTAVLPIKRHDKTAKERLLIFNLWSGAPSNDGYSLGCKASIITQLLYLEGINNSIEQRAIERLIQGWKKERALTY